MNSPAVLETSAGAVPYIGYTAARRLEPLRHSLTLTGVAQLCQSVSTTQNEC